MTFHNVRLIGASVLCFGVGMGAAQAANVSPDVIFGSGNANGSFTIGTGSFASGTVELGLRGKLRFNASNAPENTFNYDGVNSYSFGAGSPTGGASWVSSTTPVWNFEWSINTDRDDDNTTALDDLTYQLRLDSDPGAGTNFQTFDPIAVPSTSTPDFADHAIGDNNSVPFDSTTGTGGGSVASDRPSYLSLIANNNVAQNSWSYEFFNAAGTPLEFFDPTQTGQYTIELEAFDSTGSIASTSIEVNVVPVPFSAPLLLGALGGLVVLRRRKAT